MVLDEIMEAFTVIVNDGSAAIAYRIHTAKINSTGAMADLVKLSLNESAKFTENLQAIIWEH